MNLTQQDYDLISERLRARFNPKQRKQVDRYYGDINLAESRELRKQLAEVDYEFFARFYLAHHFSKPPAPLHRLTFREIEYIVKSPGRMASATVWPRGFGKTTTVTLGLPLWCIGFGIKHCIPIVSDSADQAKGQLTTLKYEITHNERFIEDFGELKGDRWQEAEIITDNGVMVSAYGSRNAIRGKKYREFRPDLIICDDLEKLKDVQSEIQREDLRDWFQRSLMRIGGFDAKTFVIGNFLHPQCLLLTITKNPAFRSQIFKAVVSWGDLELWDRWREIAVDIDNVDHLKDALAFFEAHKKAMLVGTKSAWPEAFPFYDLMLMRVSEGAASFATEMQNNPIDPSKRFFKTVRTYKQVVREHNGVYEIYLVPSEGGIEVPLRACKIFAATDPSMGQSRRSDYSAIIVCAVAPSRRMFVLVADIRRRSPNETISAQNAWHDKYHTVRWGIEKNQFQAFYATVSGERSLEELDIPLPVVAVTQTRNKDLRIQSLQPDLENGYILLAEAGQEELYKQIVEYAPGTRGQHDDGPDALELCRFVMRKFSKTEYSADTTTAEVHAYHNEHGSKSVGVQGDDWDELEKEVGTFVPRLVR